MILRLTCCILAISFTIQAQQVPKPPKKKAAAKKGWNLRWNHRPEIRYSDKLEIDVRLKFQGNLRRVDEQGFDSVDQAEVRRSRAGIEGRFLRDYEYQLELELDNRASWLRDAWVNYRRFRTFQLQAGQFKIPFGRDQLTSPMNMDFVFRSRVGQVLSPARDQGVMAHGRAAGGGLRWQAGMFRGDGEMSLTRDRQRTARLCIAARLVVNPYEYLPLPRMMKSLDLGTAATRSSTDATSLSLRGRTGVDDTFFNHIPINGNRTRTGIEALWTPGPFGFQAEAVQVREQRIGQSVSGAGLPDLLSRGWYAQASWVVTGDNKTAGRLRPRKPLFGGGWGALELAGRREYIGFRSDTSEGIPSRSPRAFNLLASGLAGWTAGTNWYPTENFKVQFNFMNNRITPNTGSSAIPYRTRVYVFSFQVVL